MYRQPLELLQSSQIELFWSGEPSNVGGNVSEKPNVSEGWSNLLLTNISLFGPSLTFGFSLTFPPTFEGSPRPKKLYLRALKEF